MGLCGISIVDENGSRCDRYRRGAGKRPSAGLYTESDFLPNTKGRLRDGIRTVLGSRGERGAALGLALRVLAGGPLGALCRGKWPDAIMAPATICIALGSSMTATNRKVPPQEQSVTRSPNVRTKSCAHVRLPGRFGEMGRSGASRGGSAPR